MSIDPYQQIRENVPIDFEARNAGVDLKGAGKVLSGKCCFHADDTPSLRVYLESNSFYCFGCGKGGDVIRFRADLDGTDRETAAHELDRRYNLGAFAGYSAERYAARVEKRRRKVEEAHGEATAVLVSAVQGLEQKAADAIEPEVADGIRQRIGIAQAALCVEAEDEYSAESVVDFKLRSLRMIGEAEAADKIARQLGGVPTPKSAAEYEGKPTRFVWYPFLPCGEYSVLAAAGGSGKGMTACLIAAYLSRGLPLPEDKPCPDALRAFPYRQPVRSLFISSEDTGDQISARLIVSNADRSMIDIQGKDLPETAELDFSTESGAEVLREMIENAEARFVVIDPMQAFIGGETDMNRAAKMRGILARISKIAEETDSSILFIAHTNKRPQDMDLNSGVLGSVETVNAARSVMHVMRDPEHDGNKFRLIVHGKANHAHLSKSVRFEIAIQDRIVNGEEIPVAGGRFAEDVFSDVTQELYVEAVRRKTSASELLKLKRYDETALDVLIESIRDEAEQLRKDGEATRSVLYDEFEDDHGVTVWAGKRPTDAVNAVSFKVIGDGIALKAGVSVHKGEKRGRGFRITLTQK